MIENPPAFPVSTIDGATNYGMTLRDWFAGNALSLHFGPTGTTATPADVARWSYEVADAMLAARQEQDHA